MSAVRTSRKRWSQADIDHARRLYESGLASPQLGRRLGYSATWLARVFKKAGIPVRPSGRPMTTPAPSVDIDELVRLREDGWSYTRIGRHCGPSDDIVRKRYLRVTGRAASS